MPDKPNVAFIELTCCAGCECALLDTNQKLFDVFSKINVVEFRLFEECESKVKKFDVSYVLGTPSTKVQVKYLQEIRKKTNFLIAYGNCSIFGSVWGAKKWYDKDKIISRVYDKPEGIDNLNFSGVRDVVKVDFEIPTCPINTEEFIRLTYDVLHGRFPIIPKRPVCYECQRAGYECVLQKGEPCFGPATLGGCNAVCLKSKMPCQGCRGPLKGANFKSLWGKVVKIIGLKRAEHILEIFGVKGAFFDTFSVGGKKIKK